jgi:hypothetical protein
VMIRPVLNKECLLLFPIINIGLYDTIA